MHLYFSLPIGLVCVLRWVLLGAQLVDAHAARVSDPPLCMLVLCLREVSWREVELAAGYCCAAPLEVGGWCCCAAPLEVGGWWVCLLARAGCAACG
jgi:hypothetical protein